MVIAVSWSGLAYAGDIHEAAARGNRQEVERLLERHPRLVYSRDWEPSPPFNGDTPLISAAFHGRAAIAQLLIAYGANVDARGGKGWTAMYAAAVWGYLDVVKVLVANRADVNERIKGGETPLYAAARNGQVEVAELLVANHADVNAEDKEGETPLWAAELHGNKEIIAMLRRAGGHE